MGKEVGTSFLGSGKILQYSFFSKKSIGNLLNNRGLTPNFQSLTLSLLVVILFGDKHEE
jgi:hypothetical protein